MKPWVSYSLIRIGLFAGVFIVLMLLGIVWWLSAIIAAIVGFSIAYIFFGRQRDALARSLYAAQNPDPDLSAGDDEAAEDAETARRHAFGDENPGSESDRRG